MVNFYTHFIVCNPSNKTTVTVADIAGELCFIQSLQNTKYYIGKLENLFKCHLFCYIIFQSDHCMRNAMTFH